MKRTVGELLESMTAAEFILWTEFYKLEPFGNEWKQAAMIAHTTATAGKLERRGGGKLTEADFMPSGYTANRRLPTPEELDEKLRTIFSALAGKGN